MLIQVAV